MIVEIQRFQQPIISTGVKLFPNTITATSLTSSAATTAGSLTVDNVVMDGATIGHSSMIRI